MNQDVICTIEQVTPEWLTATLRRAGTLPEGEVVGTAIDAPEKTFASLTWHLHLIYSDDVTADAPTRLFLKSSSPELAPGDHESERIEKEIDFYRTVAPAMDDVLSVPCYDVAYNRDTRASHLLLLDLSDTHETCFDPLCNQRAWQAVECLACLHAFWWDHPRLGQDIGSFPAQEKREEDWAEAEKAVGEFLIALGEQLRMEWRLVYKRVVRSLPRLGQRHMQGLDLTLVHGDAHLGNFLFPREGVVQPAYMIDWQFWHPTIGGTDLAFMMATDWEPSVRRQLEGTLLRRYHESLIRRGVRGYDWAKCWEDYRLSVMLVSLFIPVWRWWTFKWEADTTTVENSMTAFEELKCGELLET